MGKLNKSCGPKPITLTRSWESASCPGRLRKSAIFCGLGLITGACNIFFTNSPCWYSISVLEQGAYQKPALKLTMSFYVLCLGQYLFGSLEKKPVAAIGCKLHIEMRCLKMNQVHYKGHRLNKVII